MADGDVLSRSRWIEMTPAPLGSIPNVIDILQGYVIGGAAIGVVDRDEGVIALSERQVLVCLGRSARHQACPAVHRVAIGSQLHDIEAGILSNVVQIDSIGPTRAAIDRSIAIMGTDEEHVIGVADLEMEAFVGGHAVSVDRRHGDRIVAQVALCRHA